jgi:hypothetical protein
MAGYVSASEDLADPWQGHIHDIGNVDRIETGPQGSGRVERKDELPPTRGPAKECKQAEKHRKYDIFPSAGLKGRPEIGPVHSPECEVQQCGGKQSGDAIFKNISDLLVHSYKFKQNIL